MGEYKHN